MRILVYEFVSGGGLAGREVPASLAREGSAMRVALVSDLADIGGHQVVTTAEDRFPVELPPGVQTVTLPGDEPDELDALMASVDAVWLIAPETGGCLADLAGRVERLGKRLLGPGADAIRRASDKGSLAERLRRAGVGVPVSVGLREGADAAQWFRVASEVGYPLVVKPARGAGCEGVWRVSEERELEGAALAATRASGQDALLIQEFVSGVAASVSILADGKRAMALAVNAQSIDVPGPIRYGGGSTPLDHPLAGVAAETAIRACEVFPGLCGWIGVDLVLTDSDAVVIEINPRLTTAYLGVRASVEPNVAELALAACDGILRPSVSSRKQVSFDAAGRVVVAAGVHR